MDPREIEQQLLRFLSREIFAPEVELSPTTDLMASGFDSMSLVRVLLFIENTFGRWIPESKITLATLRDVRSLAATVADLLHEP